MNRTRKLIMASLTLTLCGVAWLISAMPTQAAPTTDVFQLKVTGKEWCKGNPKFFETFQVKAKDGVTVTITRDPQNTGDLTAIQATVHNTGSADLDAITMTGLAFPSNKAGRTAQIILLGTLNNGHWLSIRGQANFDKLGNLTNVTGTFWDQITGTYTIDKFGNQSAPVDCFDSGTLVTGKKL